MLSQYFFLNHRGLQKMCREYLTQMMIISNILAFHNANTKVLLRVY